MRALLFGLALVSLVPRGVGSHASTSPAGRGCVPTEHMPIAGLHARPPERMPVLRPDTSWHGRMPTRALIPCYLVNR